MCGGGRDLYSIIMPQPVRIDIFEIYHIIT